MINTLQTTLDYIRHGEPVSGSGRYRGHGIDDPLSEKGWAQMFATTANLKDWHHIISSPMQRCQAFAERLGQERELPVTVIDDLKEVGFGSWEGATRTELLANRAEEYHAFQENPVLNRPEGAESLTDFGKRVSQVFDQLAAEYVGQHLLVVAHAGVIRATFGYVTQAPAINWYRTKVDNAGLSRFNADKKGRKLVFHNWRPDIQ